jgi:hypothetical protein
MKLLLVSKLDRFARAVSTITNYVQTGTALGHQVAVFGEESSEIPLPYSLDVKQFDFVIFVIYESWDFPDMPYLARLLDGIPKQRRVIIDCYGRYNDTIRVEHDFNHLEKMDGHQGWEWVEGFRSVSEKILQPTLQPLRPDARPFLFHAYDPSAVLCSYSSPTQAANAWSGRTNGTRPYGVTYVGNNWQRWTQVQNFLEKIEPVKEELGRICIAGSGWDQTPDWAKQLGVHGADVDPIVLERLNVERKNPIPFEEVVKLLGQGRFSPIFHRPLFQHLGIVTNRTFETFYADTIPLLMLPREQIEAIYGANALALSPSDDLPGRLLDMIRRPDLYWDAVLKTRVHLAEHHSYKQRFLELLKILES